MFRNVAKWSTASMWAAFSLPALPLAAMAMFPQLRFSLAPTAYLLFHNVTEFFSIMVSFSMFGIGWYTYEQSHNRQALFLSTAFLGIGLMDCMHMFANSAMPAFITPNSANKSTQFWIAVRLFQAVVFLVSAYIDAEKPRRWLSKKTLLTSVLLVVALVFSGIVFFPSYMPATFVPGSGLTPFKRMTEFLIIALFCAAALAYWRRMRRTGDPLLIYYTAALVISIFSELPLAVYATVYDTYNVLGHIYKVAAFYLIYHGIYKSSVRAPYLLLTAVGEKLKAEIAERKRTEEDLRHAHDHLERRVQERTAELSQSNLHLHREIKAHRKVQKALNESESFYRAIAQNFPEGAIYVFDHDLRFRVADGQNLATLGYSRDKLEGRTIWEAADPEVCAILERRFLGVLAGGTFHFETPLKGRVFSSAYVPIRDGQGKVIAGMVVSHDITERKKAEEVLRQLNETLEARVAERTELAETRSKQLQSLAVELIEAEEQERRRIAQLLHDDLQQILAAARFQLQAVYPTLSPEPMLASVEHLLEESITKSRRLSHELSPAVLYHAGLFAALKWLAGQMREQFGLQVRLEVTVGQPLESMPLKVFVFRAVQELLFNVVKHAGVKSARVCLSGTEESVTLTVSDEGRGFDPDILNPSTSRVGLGLLSIRERASYIGGGFAIQSAAGQGSRFTLTIPLTLSGAEAAPALETRPRSAAPAEAIQRADGQCIRVLFADDHKVMRQGLIRLMSGQPNIQVVGEASNGREAVELARQLRPHVVVMDVSMPEMDGIEATRQIKSDLPELRVVGLSMFEDEHASRSMREAGADAFVCKSASSVALLRAIYKITGEGTGRRQDGSSPAKRKAPGAVTKVADPQFAL